MSGKVLSIARFTRDVEGLVELERRFCKGWALAWGFCDEASWADIDHLNKGALVCVVRKPTYKTCIVKVMQCSFKQAGSSFRVGFWSSGRRVVCLNVALPAFRARCRELGGFAEAIATVFANATEPLLGSISPKSYA